MLIPAIKFVVETLFNLFILSALLRFWMQVLRAPARNPIAQFTMALTDFAVKPLRRIVPGLFGLDLASLIVAWLAEFVLLVILLLLDDLPLAQYPAALTPVLFWALVKLVRLSVYIVLGAVFIQAILSWVNPYHPVMPFFDALTRPFLKPFRKMVPLIGGVDITPILVLIIGQLILMIPVTWLEEACKATTLRMLAGY
jgi:YggT family protein